MADTRTGISIVPQEFSVSTPFANATYAFFGPTTNEVTLSFLRVPAGPVSVPEGTTELKAPVVSAVTMTVDVALGLARSILENVSPELRASTITSIASRPGKGG